MDDCSEHKGNKKETDIWSSKRNVQLAGGTTAWEKESFYSNMMLYTLTKTPTRGMSTHRQCWVQQESDSWFLCHYGWGRGCYCQQQWLLCGCWWVPQQKLDLGSSNKFSRSIYTLRAYMRKSRGPLDLPTLELGQNIQQAYLGKIKTQV